MVRLGDLEIEKTSYAPQKVGKWRMRVCMHMQPWRRSGGGLFSKQQSPKEDASPFPPIAATRARVRPRRPRPPALTMTEMDGRRT